MSALPTLARKIIRVDGTEVALDKPLSISEINNLIRANGLDAVNMRDRGRHVMMVDDTGMIDGKPVNAKATALYHSVCRPGTTHPICGDVVIVLDEDFA